MSSHGYFARFVLVTILALSSSSPAPAVVVEQIGGASIDWSSFRVRVYGDAVASNSDGDSALKLAEKRARAAGLEALSAMAAKGPDGLALSAAALAQSAVSAGTTYFGDGTVRVYLDANLSGATAGVAGATFARSDLVDTAGVEATGVVFSIDRKAKPHASYKVVAEDGAVLFDVSAMAESAFRKNLMGRWLNHPVPADLAAVVGDRPVRVRLVTSGNGVFRVARAEWEAALKGASPLLANGRVALVQP